MTTTTETTFNASIVGDIAQRLYDVAISLRGDLGSPALAEIRRAERAAERAQILLSPWGPLADAIDQDAILAAVEKFILRNDSIPMPPEEYWNTATLESSALEGGPDEYVRVTMTGCVYLVIGETDSFDDEDYSTKTIWSVVGRYPQ